MYFYTLFLVMQGKAAGAFGVAFIGFLAARYGIRNRVFKLSFLIIGATLFAFAYFRFTDSIWAGVIVGLLGLVGIYFSDYKIKGAISGGEDT